MGLNHRPDAMMLEGACTNYARAVEADLLVVREGIMVNESIIDDESGEIIVLKRKYHPGITVSNSAWRQVRAFCSEFGLSPVSRTRLTIEKPKTPEEELGALLSRPRVKEQAVQ
jgi:P27 family predicted phage terminase small subunit